MYKFIIIGIDDNTVQSFSDEVMGVIRRHHVFSGGQRHHEIVKEKLPPGSVWIDITVPIDGVFRAYSKWDSVDDGSAEDDGCRGIVVFASGDPLFFGFANTVKRRLPEADMVLYPTFNSIQTLAHRTVTPYHDMRVVSLTGRPWHEFDRALIERSVKMGVLTDGEHTPDAVARRMVTYGYTNYRMTVGEHLGNKAKERITQWRLEDACKETFDRPNCLILTAAGQSRPRYFGIPDDLFEHLDGRGKMITKASIRLLTLSALGLQQRTSFWDIGFCTGAVSIEAKLQFPHLYITSFEIRDEGEELMRTNGRRFGAPGITTVIGDFLTADLSLYPMPDAIFIGGHGGHLKEMVHRAIGVLADGGVIVFNSVTETSRQQFSEAVEAECLTSQSTLHVAINEYNPIDIMSCKKENK